MSIILVDTSNMASYHNGVPEPPQLLSTSPFPAEPRSWAAKDIAYVCVIGPLSLLAAIEWFLFMASFNYCLWKVYQKGELLSTRILAVVISLSFTIFRAIFLPIMVFTMPLPPELSQYIPQKLASDLTWMAFFCFSTMLILPWIGCVFRLITHNVGKSKKIKHVLNEFSAPKVMVVMPVYSETPSVLLTALDSVVTCDYPAGCLHVFLSFDGDEENELYLSTVIALGVDLSIDSFPRCIDAIFKGVRVTISRFPHSGKRGTQKKTFALIDKIYHDYLKRNDDLFMLFIDSDCILDHVCIQNFMYEMELKPGSDRKMLAMTGVITCTSAPHNFLSTLQDIEYVHGQLFERTVESVCGAVTCLPGALTMLRFSAFRNVAKYYFADNTDKIEDLFDYWKCHLGEDRWLTHLLMVGSKSMFQISFCAGAFCKTEAVQTFFSLVKQRRRWFLGSVTNEAAMLTDLRLWTKFPIMCLYRFAQCTIRTTALLLFILFIALASQQGSAKSLPVGFIAMSLGLNWALMISFGIVLHRYKLWFYPLMFIINPVFNCIYMIYGIFTAGQRTWGGPRVDAAAADEKTTPQQAIEQAKAAGDDLNIVPETFKEVASLHGLAQNHAQHSSVLPPSNIEGMFAAPDLLPDGWFAQPIGSPLRSVSDVHSQMGQAALNTSDNKARLLPSSKIDQNTNEIYQARVGGTIVDISEEAIRKLHLLEDGKK